MGMIRQGLSYWQADTGGTTLLEMTIGDLLDRRAEEFPDHEAVVYSCYPEAGGALNLRWTYKEYRERANAVAKGLLALGLKKGDHIAVLAANIPEWLLVEMAAVKLGLVLVTINPILQQAEIEYICQQGDVQALFFMAQVRGYNHLATIRSLITPGTEHGQVTSERLPMLRFVCLIGTPPEELSDKQDWRPVLLDEATDGGSRISDEELSRLQASVNFMDPAMILYTSGTTGAPKGAMLTHYGLLNNAQLSAERGRMRQTDRLCTPMPFFHVGAGVLAILAALYVGNPLHPLVTFDVEKSLQVISSERCTFFLCVPTMMIALLQHPDFERFDLSSMQRIVTGGTAIPVSLMEQVHARIGATPMIVFAQTEASCTMTQTLPDDPFERQAATCGVPLPHTAIKIVDSLSGEVAACGERGEICTRGYLVMKGYYKMPEKTAQAIDSEGWLHTGDLATMDESGHINIVGRLKDMVIRGGENLFPAEIEEFLLRHPKVADAQIVGVPDSFFGEELLAVVRTKQDVTLSEQELREYCKGQISHQKIPRYFQFVESYPMTASGKIQKFVLRESAIKELGLEEIRDTPTA